MNDEGDVIETTTTRDRLPSGVGFVYMLLTKTFHASR